MHLSPTITRFSVHVVMVKEKRLMIFLLKIENKSNYVKQLFLYQFQRFHDSAVIRTDCFHNNYAMKRKESKMFIKYTCKFDWKTDIYTRMKLFIEKGMPFNLTNLDLFLSMYRLLRIAIRVVVLPYIMNRIEDIIL